VWRRFDEFEFIFIEYSIILYGTNRKCDRAGGEWKSESHRAGCGDHQLIAVWQVIQKRVPA
jgi:hypothetical protein